MGPVRLLDEAHAAGLTVAIEGNKLVVRGPRRAEPIAHKLLASKREVMAALANIRAPAAVPVGTTDSADAACWRELFEERAAFRQYEAGYRRDLAEGLAFGEVLEAWCRRHPQAISPAICAGCDRPVAGEVVLDLPDGACVHWVRHREFACLIEAGVRRKQRAVEALAAVGLAPPPGWQV